MDCNSTLNVHHFRAGTAENLRNFHQSTHSSQAEDEVTTNYAHRYAPSQTQIDLTNGDFSHLFDANKTKTPRENLENFYTGALAADVNRSMNFGGTRGLSTHAVSNSLSMRQESLRLEKTLKLRQKAKALED